MDIEPQINTNSVTVGVLVHFLLLFYTPRQNLLGRGKGLPELLATVHHGGGQSRSLKQEPDGRNF